VLATTVRLWLRRRLSWTRRPRPGRARWLALIVAGLVAAVLLAVAATVVLSGPGRPSAGQPGARRPSPRQRRGPAAGVITWRSQAG
jgi:hypothetical protein